MTFEEIRLYLSGLPETTLEYPFGPESAVFKVKGKMYALVAWEALPLRISLKCDPMEVDAMRQTYPAISPPRYLNKQHWNAVVLDGSISDEFIQELLEDSYALVVAGLTKAVRAELGR